MKRLKWKKTPQGGYFIETSILLIEILRGLGGRRWSWNVYLNGMTRFPDKKTKTQVLVMQAGGSALTLRQAKWAAAASAYKLVAGEARAIQGLGLAPNRP